MRRPIKRRKMTLAEKKLSAEISNTAKGFAVPAALAEMAPVRKEEGPMTTGRLPTVGDIVVYHDLIEDSGMDSYAAGPFPAIVVRANSDGTLNLAVLRDDCNEQGCMSGYAEIRYCVGLANGMAPVWASPCGWQGHWSLRS